MSQGRSLGRSTNRSGGGLLLLQTLGVCVALLSLGVVSTDAQQQGAIDPAAVPIEQEPRHHLMLANDLVRVIDALLPPLYVSQNHTHTFDYVVVTILPGVGGPAGQARTGFAAFGRGGYSHIVTNPNTQPMRFIAVELREGDRSGMPGMSEPEEDVEAHHSIELVNERVVVRRVRLEPSERLPDHRHAAGYVSVVVRGGDGPGAWKWHSAGEAGAPLDAGKQPLEVVEIEPR